MVSELVTNALRYGGGVVITLRLIREGDRLICEVSDPSSTVPHLKRAHTDDEGGRGLFIVAQVSRQWGVRFTNHGKVIWTELPWR
ncbi:ATP-binding protein [Streptomyces fagopyri]|uniref:ATP-binding protein n=1 Tax=Streptomyces fagopyri TaxID=2662397 RepID=UPI0036CC5679